MPVVFKPLKRIGNIMKNKENELVYCDDCKWEKVLYHIEGDYDLYYCKNPDCVEAQREYKEKVYLAHPYRYTFLGRCEGLNRSHNCKYYEYIKKKKTLGYYYSHTVDQHFFITYFSTLFIFVFLGVIIMCFLFGVGKHH